MGIGIQVFVENRPAPKLQPQTLGHAAAHARCSMQAPIGETDVIEKQPGAAILIIAGEKVRDKRSRR